MAKRSFLYTVVLCVAILWLSLPAHGREMPEVMFILDASGSMWGPAGDIRKIEAAKEVMAKVVPALPDGVGVGLTVYGHRKKDDCSDVEIMIPSGSTDRAGLLAKVKAIRPKGMTPMAASVSMVADALKLKEGETTIILVSDGIETCDKDPCATIKGLKDSGIKFILHVVGFGVDQKGRDQLTCFSEAGGGTYFQATDAQSLLAALETVQKEVAVKVEEAKTTTVKAQTRLGKLKITMPESAIKTQGEIKIVRVKDNKVIKLAKPESEGTHPLLAGEYEVVLQFNNTNYKPASEASLGRFEVKGGEVTEIHLGAMVLNKAKGLGDAAEAVVILPAGSDTPFVRNDAGGNDYYLWRTKPLPAGTYDLGVVYGRSPDLFRVVKGIVIEAGKETVVTLDSGIQITPNPQIVSWQLTPSGREECILKVKRRWDNDYPLWKAFPVTPGTYDLGVFLKGMDEPLPAGEGIEIKKGEVLLFDPGL
ncbi:MAG: VWA domain-containing protein [Deltaproteobacteria bacterium]|nr:VWA domain-containing protein [Deltaproteobacteria bacterium]